MSNYDKLKSVGLSDDASLCIDDAIKSTSAIIGNDPAISLRQTYNINGAPDGKILYIEGKDSSVHLYKEGGGIAGPAASPDNGSEQIEKYFGPCSRFIP